MIRTTVQKLATTTTTATSLRACIPSSVATTTTIHHNECQQKRCYARAQIDEESHSDKGLLMAAMKDYMRKTKFAHLNTRKSYHDFQKDKALADQNSFQIKIRKEKLRAELKKKAQLKEKALNAMPIELRTEAVKLDYSQWPVLLQPLDYVLPAQEGFRLPDEPAKNEL